jgi:hypothetical protein
MTEPDSSTAEPDPCDDYGYDLAHEVKDALRIPVARRRHSATPSRPGPGRPPEQDGDLGYDDAHEIRGS